MQVLTAETSDEGAAQAACEEMLLCEESPALPHGGCRETSYGDAICCCARSSHDGCVQDPDVHSRLREAPGAGKHVLERRHLDALGAFAACPVDKEAVLKHKHCIPCRVPYLYCVSHPQCSG